MRRRMMKSKIHRATVTDAAGFYRFTAMPPGDYEVTFTMPGFATEKKQLPVVLMQNSQVDVTMRAATFEGEIVVTFDDAMNRDIEAILTFVAKELLKDEARELEDGEEALLKSRLEELGYL